MLQSPEGGFLSVGNRRFRIRRSVTPPLTPVSVTPLEKVPVAMPANMLTERIPPRVRSSRFSTLPAATDKIVDLEERAGRALPDDLCLRHRDDPGDRSHACPRERSAGAPRAGTGRAADDADRASGEARSGGSVPGAVVQPSPSAVGGHAPSSGRRSGGRPAPASREVRREDPPGRCSLICRRRPLPRRAADRRRAGPRPRRRRPTSGRARRCGATLRRRARRPLRTRIPAMPAPTKKKWVDPFDQ